MKRFLVFSPAFVLGFGILLVSGIRKQFAMAPPQPMKALPQQVVGYQSRDIVIADEERRVAGMSDYAFREFTRADSAQPFSVYVGYYERQVQGKTIHSPKNCLPGAGWEVLETARVPLSKESSALGNRVLLANGRARALVYYWYQGRGRIESSEYRVKWDLLRDAAMHGRTEESLVRIVVPLPEVVGPNDASKESARSADVLVAGIAKELVPAVYAVMPLFPGT